MSQFPSFSDDAVDDVEDLAVEAPAETHFDGDGETDVDESPGGQTGGHRAGSRSNRALIRRVANKAQEVTEADAVTRAVAASLLGSADSLSDLTTAIMSADRGVTQPISDLHTIADADPFEAATVAGAMGRDRMKAVWRLLASFDSAPSASVPASNPKAALDLAKHIKQSVDFEALGRELAPVAALLKKN